jgi:hypothetical protein
MPAVRAQARGAERQQQRRAIMGISGFDERNGDGGPLQRGHPPVFRQTGKRRATRCNIPSRGIVE